MIRGSIEVVSQHLVQGWIHAEGVSLRDATVLAFAGANCVGSGTVGIYRKDLEDAGLGDGYLGFSIDISVPEQLLPSITVRLNRSDAALLQSSSIVVGAVEQRPAITREAQARQIDCLKWALQRCRLSQSEFDFLRVLCTFGIYERGLARRAAPGDHAEGSNAAAVIQEMMEAQASGPVELKVRRLEHHENFSSVVSEILMTPSSLPILALTADRPCSFEVLEGSHVVDSAIARKPVTYLLTAANVLVADARLGMRLLPLDHLDTRLDVYYSLSSMGH